MFSTWYSVSKAMHLIGMVSWMAGLFYLVRIMVYHAEARARTASERDVLLKQYTFMEWKVYKVILQPAVVITWSFGVALLCLQPLWLQESWMHVKLAFLLLLTGYTHYCKGQIRKLEAGDPSLTHLHYRVLNEVPTLIMVAVIFLAVFKSRIHYPTLALGLAAFTGLIAWGIWSVNKKR